ncbi:hypothetical protein KCP78_06655 [Salmonella enterica subsp. enterica]|nr:hypothetical protein KCP78_06655 [Salmonella enterica subsp. enterica]
MRQLAGESISSTSLPLRRVRIAPSPSPEGRLGFGINSAAARISFDGDQLLFSSSKVQWTK